MNNHARQPAIGEVVHFRQAGRSGARCRAALVTEQRVGMDGRQTALTVFVRGGFFFVDATHNEDADDDTWHHECGH